MKYLTKAFEEKFIEHCGKEKRYSGKLFENLVFMLLEDTFPLFNWKDTPVTHDGSKDFYAQKEERIYWAECKNYNDKISLQTIAPTLVMAQLCNADEIYFFSRSSINENAKKKLCYYAHINRKKIRFYDDIVLEQMIFNNKRVYNYFFKEYQFSQVDFQHEAVPQILCNYLKNPFLNYNKNETFLSKTNLPIFKVNEILSLHVYGINNNINKDATITIRIDPDCEDLLCFELLKKDMKRSDILNYCYTESIAPNGIFIHCIDLKIISFKSKLTVPKLIVDVSQAECSIQEDLIWGDFRCSKLHKSQFLDSYYLDILYEIEHEMLNKDILSGVLLIGTSGTGKSRTLEEMLSLFIKYDYKVLNFIGVENDSGKSIIKEIIYILFEVSEELIAKSFSLKEKEVESAFSLAFKMLYEINQEKTDIIEIIDMYGEIIFERLIHGSYALIIDNIQYFDQPLLYFLEKLIIYGKNCNRENTLFLALSMNTDYCCSNTEVAKIKVLFHQLQKTSACKMKIHYINGFHTLGSAVEFIKQILGIKNNNYDNLFFKILDKSSLKPFYIESIIENLNELDSVSFFNNRLLIDKPTCFIKELSHLPGSTEESLKRRWQFYVSKHFNELDSIQILSIIHTFGECENELIKKLKLNRVVLKELCKHNFLKEEIDINTRKYTFTHDLIEKFFCEYFIDFDDIAYKYLNEIGYAHLRRSFPIVYNLCVLYSKNYTTNELESIIQNGVSIGIPYKIFYNYYKSCIDALLEYYDDFNNKSQWYSLCFFSIKQIKIRIGNESAHEVFKQLFSVLENGDFEDRYLYVDFSDLLFYYGEIKQQLTLFHEVIALYLYYLEKYINVKNTCLDKYVQYVIIFIYNRLSVAYKHLPGTDSRQKQLKYIDQSLYASRTLTNRQYLAENCYDKGSYYYCHVKYKKKVLAYWQSCCTLIKKYNIEVMTLHFIEHQIQIALIKQQLTDIPQLLEYGFDYIEHGKYNEQGIYFKRFFNQAKAIYWLLKKENYDIIYESLIQAEEALLMLGKNNLTYVNYLWGKLYFYLNDISKTYEFYKEAYRQSANLTILYKEEFIDMLTHDMLIKFRQMNINREAFPINFLSKMKHNLMATQLFAMDQEQFLNFLNNYKATSIIHSLDGKENFPNI